MNTEDFVLEQIGISFQKDLDAKMDAIESKLHLEEVTDKMTAKMMAITIRDWCSHLLVFDGVVLDVNDIRECDSYDARNIVTMVNKYWELSNLRDSCDFIDSNTMVLQTIIKKNHTIMCNLDEEQDWKQYLAQRVKSQKISICGFITHRYDKYKD